MGKAKRDFSFQWFPDWGSSEHYYFIICILFQHCYAPKPMGELSWGMHSVYLRGKKKNQGEFLGGQQQSEQDRRNQEMRKEKVLRE